MSQTPIIYQHSTGIEIGYRQVDDQSIVMRVIESLGVIFYEADGWVINLSHFRQSVRKLDALHHP